jgi:hypothetical protein
LGKDTFGTYNVIDVEEEKVNKAQAALKGLQV